MVFISENTRHHSGCRLVLGDVQVSAFFVDKYSRTLTSGLARGGAVGSRLYLNRTGTKGVFVEYRFMTSTSHPVSSGIAKETGGPISIEPAAAKP